MKISQIVHHSRLMKIAAPVLLLMMLVVGCGQQQNATTEAKPSETKQEGTAYKVKHAMGETNVNGTPQRVVVLTREGTEAVLELGVKPVGAVQSWDKKDQPFYDHIKADMEGVKDVGDELQPNIEAIAALKPDLILGVKMRHEKIYDQLSAVAPTVLAETLRGEWKNNFKLYAEALHKKAEGDKVIADFDKKVADLRAKAGDKLKTEVSLVRFMPGKTRIYYSQTFAGMLLNEVGFARPKAQQKDDFAAEITKERMPELDGDILFYYTYNKGVKDDSGSKLEQEWTNDPLWKNLKVSKNNKVFKVDDVIWNIAGGVRAANLLLDEFDKYLVEGKQ
ncbi:iron siderophore-binding protein [Brevibacillus laterosporus]|uniref:ABC transporter substrate-binding protein n=1 Tax=Brevibacillus laterosporus TaxID=1465 RepID=UPI000C786BD3|nr:iron-siderophore ABC transporter substrate-binding protein [Brevibacillus laterosporus]AUM67081.1 iron siderophore-binding protein [Brevibacillus laterosporus]